MEVQGWQIAKLHAQGGVRRTMITYTLICRITHKHEVTNGDRGGSLNPRC
ncbi:hypothetical protein GBAR_LOCUS26542 [Geodia barretti]|uniref:Uncharacterized protein n=1 Tax=Geodia barretti TaxID=519541 RepID=A0AA35X8D9_GEOBA|nr:hypothetical protein GBAR_LOCUS26542 [Geodia barretti]